MERHAHYVLAIAVIVVVVLVAGIPGVNRDQTPAPVATSDTPAPVVVDPHGWNESDRMILASLWLEKLPPLPPDPSNAVADDPRAAEFGHHLFFDKRLSSNGEVSCSSCHKPELKFTDGLPRAVGVGVTPRKAMTVIGMAYSPWMFWDGRKDSQWSQALGPLESPVEHGANRSVYVHLLAEDADYRRRYEELFGTLPDISDESRFPRSAGPVPDPVAKAAWAAMTPEDQDTINRIFSNMGKAIAAYERLIMPGPAPFDDYIAAVMANDRSRMQDIYTENEARGLKLFTGKAQCINCHNGPLLTNHSFHNTGIPPATDLPPDFGRIEGVLEVMTDPFNCLGSYSDAKENECPYLTYARTEGAELVAAFKTPTLRNVADMPPYMHSGQIPNLEAAVDHYSRAPFAVRGHSEVAELKLSAEEQADLVAFLKTLSAPLATDPAMLADPFASSEETAPAAM